VKPRWEEYKKTNVFPFEDYFKDSIATPEEQYN
jgi:hypothetical protein